jgi:hypothetical protein
MKRKQTAVLHQGQESDLTTTDNLNLNTISKKGKATHTPCSDSKQETTVAIVN